VFIFLLFSALHSSDACMATPGTGTNPCRSCADSLITKSTSTNNGVKPFDGDVRTAGTTCAQRTLTCNGVGPSIELNNMDGTLLDETDGTVDGSASIVVNCNTAGTAWLYQGLEITRLECAAGLQPSCNTCADNLITILMMNPNAQPFMSDMVDNTGPCRTRRLTCMGVNANIEVNGMNGGVISDADDGMRDNLASIDLTCNADGTAWTRMGAPITRLECASGGALTVCQSCMLNLISITTTGAGAKVFDSDVVTDIDPVTMCATRVLVCRGLNANVDINGRQGILMDADDGNMDGAVTVTLNCNAAGDAWTMQGVPITELECAAG
ncbi:hypothetical protein PFISCL1PPCAC_14731, partial [Pristionchus fissidentatus]